MIEEETNEASGSKMNTLDFNQIIQEYADIQPSSAQDSRLNMPRVLAAVIKFLSKLNTEDWHLIFEEKQRTKINWKKASILSLVLYFIEF